MKHSYYLFVLLVSVGLLMCSFGATAQLIVEWDKTWGGLKDDRPEEVVASPDGGYLVAGTSTSPVSIDKSENPIGGCDQEGNCDSDIWLIKTDSDGNKQWDKVLGSRINDPIAEVIPLADGGFLLGGVTMGSTGYSDYWLVKIDENGNKYWEETYGGGNGESLQKVIATADGGYLLAGMSSSRATRDKSEPNRGWNDYWVVKIDAQGNQQWDKTLGGASSEGLRDVIATPDGGYLLGGDSQSHASGDKTQDKIGGDRDQDYWIVKIDGSGNKLWDKSYGTTESDYFRNFLPTVDGNYILAGSTYSGGISLLKIDGSGNQLWYKTYGGNLNSAITTDDGNHLLLSSSYGPAFGKRTEDSRGRHDYWVLKIDPDGNMLWDETIGGNWEDRPTDVTSTPDGGYLLAGYSRSDAIADKSEGRRGDNDYWIVKVVEGEDEEKESFGVGGFSLVNADENEVLFSLLDGVKVNLYEIGTSLLSVRAVPHPLKVDKIVFELSGPITRTHTENSWPYTLFGDEQYPAGSNNYYGWDWVPGAYTLKATPYLDGKAGKALQVSFSVIDEPPVSVSYFVLVNADTDQNIRILREGDVVDLSALGNPQLSIRAVTSPLKIEKIEFNIYGVSGPSDVPLRHAQTETQWPYALFGDSRKAGSKGRDYIGMDLPPAKYSLTVTPYINFMQGEISRLNFTVVEGSSNARLAVKAYPVPTRGVINVKHEGTGQQASMMLLDFAGNVVLERSLGNQKIEQLDLSSFKKGFYYLKIIQQQQVQVKRIVLE